MCIICNLPESELGYEFLHEFTVASLAMKRAVDAMYACSKAANTAEAINRYDRVHKEMVRIRTAWNQIEHKRELTSTG